MPNLTDDLHRVSIFKLTSADSDRFDPYLFFAWTLCVAEIRLNEDFCTGDVILCDLSCTGLGHLTKVTPILLKKAATVTEVS